MQIIRRRGEQTIAALVVAAIGLLALAAPLMFDFGTSEFKFGHVTVNAAPGDSYEVTAPLPIGRSTGITLERGLIQIIDPRGGSALGQLDPALMNGSAQLLVEGGTFTLAGNTQPAELPAISPEYPLAPLAQVLMDLNLEALVLRRSIVNVQLPDGRTEVLTDVSGELGVRKKTQLTARGTGRLRGREISFEVTSHTAIDRRASLVPLKLRLKSALLEISFDGKLGAAEGLQLQGQAEITATNLRDVAQWLGKPWPAGPTLSNVKVKGELDWQAPALAFSKVTVQMDGNEGAGTLTLAFGEQRPTVTGTLAFKSLDVTPYLRSPPPDQTSILSWTTRVTGPFSMSMSQYFDADVRLSAAKVFVHGLAIGGCAATLSLKDGRLMADVAELTLDNGHGSGQLTADFNGNLPQFAFSGKLEEIDAGRASALLLGHAALDGQSTIVADLAAVGDSPSDLVRTLNGKIRVSLQEGGSLGIDLKGLVGATQSKGLEGWGVATRGQTAVDKLEAKLLVKNGIVGSELVEAVAGENLISATGTVSLPSNQVDMRLLLQPTPSASPRALSIVKRDTIVFRGPWAAPTIETLKPTSFDGANPG